MLVDKQNELIRDLLFTVNQHGGDDVTWKPPIVNVLHSKDAINSSENVLFMEVCTVRIILEKSKQWML